MNSAQLSVTAAFVVIGVLIAAKHSDALSGWISWLYAPAKKAVKPSG